MVRDDDDGERFIILAYALVRINPTYVRARIVLAAAAAMTSEHQIINFIIITSLFPWADSLDPRWPADFSLMTTATEKIKRSKIIPEHRLSEEN